ncbi:hypothetical protein E3N88_18574 [Mikania micrantha]|uniref:Protein kinase domain-containing protein n=1 Tax=Mikania micrantha TaxID=192012 RepID=A0A5N6NNI5_9ASTR|nr:hypothetical protein E3N88_18574 [Mikania micrantha]
MKNYGRQANWVRRNCIGKGSFGVVSLAVDESDGRFPFAVKSVNQNSGNLLRCLENEIQILKSLSSPYVVRYIGDDVTCEFSTVYRNLHMEYIPNGTVAGVGKLTCDNANLRGYIRCIASALSYIHARNVVHCDVKGANVLIGHTPGTAKLADFGSAVELDMVSVLGPRGSPQWMAPERGKTGELTLSAKLGTPMTYRNWKFRSSEEFHQFNMMNRSTAEQRIGKLASNSRVKWESEGWETVRLRVKHRRNVPIPSTEWELGRYGI